MYKSQLIKAKNWWIKKRKMPLKTFMSLNTTSQTLWLLNKWSVYYTDVIMGAMASRFTSLAIVYSAVYLGANQRKHQSSASLAFVRGIHRGPVNSPHKGPVTMKMFPFDDVIMRYFYDICSIIWYIYLHETNRMVNWQYMYYRFLVTRRIQPLSQ